MEASPIKPLSYYNRWAQIILIGGNTAGAILTMFYFGYIDPIPVSDGQAFQSFKGYELLINVVGILILLGIGSSMAVFGERGIEASYNRLLEGMSASDVDEGVRRRVLNYPAFAALNSAIMWLVASIFMGLLPTGEFRTMLNVLGVGGVLTVAIVYFGMDTIWRDVVVVFFPDGKVSAVRAVKLPVFRRLLIVSILIGLYPVVMLSAVTVSRAEAMLTASNPRLVLTNLVYAMLFVVAISLFLSISLTLLVTHSIVRPLTMLRDSMARVEQNDLRTQVKVVSNDELGYVSERFNEMVGGLRQAEMMRNLLNIYVSPEVARDAMEHGTQLGGQLVECSILFSDIRGFTTLSEQMAAQDLIELLNRYMSRMVDVVIANGGIVNKFGGDSLLALFGTPLNPAQDHAARAIRAALHMQKALKSFNAEQETCCAPTLHIGIGIASGPAVAGNVGGEGRIEYTVIGDTVNLASRLQDMTKDLGRDILANASAVEQATHHMSLAAEPLQPLNVRGKAESVKVYAIISTLGEEL